jgi:voltage-gated potassium channel Kch
LRRLDPRRTLVIDFDPDVIHRVARRGFSTTYGDLTDDEVIERIFSARPKVIVSTSPEVEDNAGLLESARELPHRPLIIVRAENENEARRLYELGADFVLLPHLMSGLSLGEVVRRGSRAELRRWRQLDLRYLAEKA